MCGLSDKSDVLMRMKGTLVPQPRAQQAPAESMKVLVTH